MKPRAILWTLIALLAAFVAAKESREPYLLLYLDDVVHPKPAPLILPLDEEVSVRLYPDTRPHIGKIARLQKGLVLVVNGREWIEEGYGFGVPIIEVDGQTYISRSASIEQQGDTLSKRYVLDTVDTPSGFFRRKYEPVAPVGSVVVSYTVKAGNIAILVDFSDLRIPWERAYLMNEQGARFFTRYQESGRTLEGRDFGKWQLTSGRGCILAAYAPLRFCVETEGPVTRYFGRELYHQYYWIGGYALAWAGIDLEVNGPVESFAYTVRLERR